MNTTLTRRGFLAASAAGLAASVLARPALGQGATRSVTTSYGTYDIPADPKRVVLMGNRVDLEIALALGITPVAMGREFSFEGSHHPDVAPWVPFDPAGVAMFDPRTATAEQILSYDPDLIILRGYTSEWEPDRFAALSKVVPHIPTDTGPWCEDMTQVGEWLGRQAQLAAVFAEHDALRDGIKAKHAALLPVMKMAYGSVEPPVVWLAGQESTAPAAQSLKDLGGIDMPFPPIAQPDGGWAQISPENLGLIGEGADAILLWAPTRDVLDKFVAENPLWPRLPQVESGRALLAPNNVGNGMVYTIMETLRLWDQVYGTLA